MSVYNIIDPSTDKIYVDFLPTSGSSSLVLNPMISNLNGGGFEFTNASNPTTAQSLATKSYVDSVATSFHLKESCLAASTADLGVGVVYDNGASGVGATLENTGGPFATFSLDGESGVLNGRYLIKNQSDNTTNGIYQLTNVGSSVHAWELTRTTDADTPDELNDSLVAILNGATNEGNIYLETAVITTIGVDPITYGLFSGPSLYLQKENNLSDVLSVQEAQANLDLTTGAFTLSYTTTGNTSLTLPTTGTLATTAEVATKQDENSNLTTLTTSTTGDIIYSSASDTLSKLNVGSEGQILTVTSGLPSWENNSASGTYLPLVNNTDQTLTINDNSATSFSINSTGATGLLAFDTTDSLEKVTMSKNLEVTGNVITNGALGVYGNTELGNAISDTVSVNAGSFSFNNDTNLNFNSDTNVVNLLDNTANMLSFDSTGKTGILAISTTDGNEAVTMSGKLTVSGHTNVQGLAYNSASVTSGTVADFSTSTDSIILPIGTTAQQPTPAEGMLRYNSETHEFEGVSGLTPAWGTIGGGSVSGPTYADNTLTYSSAGLLQPPPAQISGSTITGTPTVLVCATMGRSTDNYNYAVFTDPIGNNGNYMWLFTQDVTTGTWAFSERVATDCAQPGARANGNTVAVACQWFTGIRNGSLKTYTFSSAGGGTLTLAQTILTSGSQYIQAVSFDGTYISCIQGGAPGDTEFINVFRYNGASWVHLTNSPYNFKTADGRLASDLSYVSSGTPNQAIVYDAQANVGGATAGRILCYTIDSGTNTLNTTAAQTIQFASGTPTGYNYGANLALFIDKTDPLTYMHVFDWDAAGGGTNRGAMRSYEYTGGSWVSRTDTNLGIVDNDHAGMVTNQAYSSEPCGIYQNKMVVSGNLNAILQYDLVKTAGAPYLTVTYASEILPDGVRFAAVNGIALSVLGDTMGYYLNDGSSPEYIEFYTRADASPDVDVTFDRTTDIIDMGQRVRFSGPVVRIPVTPVGTVQSLVPTLEDGSMFIDDATGVLKYVWQDKWVNSAFGSTSGIPLSGYVPGSGNLKISGEILDCTHLNIRTGSNATAGTDTLIAGVKTVNTTAITASSLVFLTRTDNSAAGTLSVTAITAGVSFEVTSSVGGETGGFNWLIIS